MIRRGVSTRLHLARVTGNRVTGAAERVRDYFLNSLSQVRRMALGLRGGWSFWLS